MLREVRFWWVSKAISFDLMNKADHLSPESLDKYCRNSNFVPVTSAPDLSTLRHHDLCM